MRGLAEQGRAGCLTGGIGRRSGTKTIRSVDCGVDKVRRGGKETYADGACIGKIIVKMEGVGWEQGRRAGGINGARAERKDT